PPLRRQAHQPRISLRRRHAHEPRHRPAAPGRPQRLRHRGPRRDDPPPQQAEPLGPAAGHHLPEPMPARPPHLRPAHPDTRAPWRHPDRTPPPLLRRSAGGKAPPAEIHAIPAPDDIHATWQPTAFVPWHQPFFNESGIYHVSVILPCDQEVACTGKVVATTK